MKTAKSKTARILPFGAFLIAAFFATTAIIESCKFSIIDDSNGGSGESRRTGTLTVQFQEKDSSRSAAAIARTVVPSIATNAGNYVVECVNAGGSTVASATLTSLTEHSFSDLVPGSITVRVKAYNAASALIATGETTVSLPGGSTVPVTVQLQPVPQTGNPTGTIALQIKWPTVSADTIDWYLDGILKQTLTASSTPNVVSDGTTSTVTLLAPGQTSGVHTIRINFNGNPAATQLEIVNVYDNMTSNRWVKPDGTLADAREYTADDVKPSAQANSTDATLRILDGVNMETLSLASTTAAYTTANVIAETSITIIPSAKLAGQKLEYEWNGGGYAVTMADAPITLGVTQNSAAKTLHLRVTPLNSGTPTEYTITVRVPIHVTDESTFLSAWSTTNGGIILDNSITLSYAATTANGSGDFHGVLDGNGNTITITGATTATENKGLFNNNYGTIENLHVDYPDGFTTSTTNCSGGIVGSNQGTIWRCYVTGSITGSAWYTGGIVGGNTGRIIECYSSAKVTGSSYVGGIAGCTAGSGLILNCYNRGMVTSSNQYAGGIAGRQTQTTSNITACYSTGFVNGNVDAGGIVGRTDGSVNACYYDTTTAGVTDSGKGNGKSDSDMKTDSTFSGWDFTNIWIRSDALNNGYPYLRGLPVTNVSIPSGSYTAAEFKAFFVDNVRTYTLAGPITITSGTWIPVGSGNDPFMGTFDGNGNTITGLSISGSSPAYQGLFGDIGTGGVVKNTILASPSVTSDGLTDAFHIGALAGTNEGLISHCGVAGGTVKGAYRTGGLVGVNSGIIEYSYSKAAVTGSGDAKFIGGLAGTNFRTITYSYAGGSVSGNDCVGGFVGLNQGGAANINHCYSRADPATLPTGADGGQIGGFAGLNTPSAIISNCYTTSLLTLSAASSYIGGFAGNSTGASVTNCYYYLAPVTPIPTDRKFGEYVGPLPDAMKSPSTYIGDWDFTNDWKIDAANDGFPYLIHNAP